MKNILINVCYIILVGVILKLFEGKQITNDIIIKLTLIICIGLVIINLLIPMKNKEKSGYNINANVSALS